MFTLRSANYESRFRFGFSLVELLVVIGIISVLVGILLPSVSAARRQAQVIQCMSNLRQLTNASMIRANENGGYLMLAGKLEVQIANAVLISQSQNRIPIGLGDPNRRRYTYARMGGSPLAAYVPVPWHASLAPYLVPSFKIPTDNWDKTEDALNDSRGVWKHFICPSTASVEKAKFDSLGGRIADEQGTLAGVVENGFLSYLWSSNLDYVANAGVLGFHHNRSIRRMRGNLSLVKDPANTMLLTDGIRRKDKPEPAQFPGFSDGWQVWDPVGSASPQSLSGALDTVATVSNKQSFDFKRHRGRINIAFADGHVEARKIDRIDLARVWVLPPVR